MDVCSGCMDTHLDGCAFVALSSLHGRDALLSSLHPFISWACCPSPFSSCPHNLGASVKLDLIDLHSLEPSLKVPVLRGLQGGCIQRPTDMYPLSDCKTKQPDH
jgi:hypothetical protein